MFDDIKNQISDLLLATLSNPRDKAQGKIVIRPITIKGDRLFQVTTQQGTKAIHQNIEIKGLWEFVESKLSDYKQLVIQTKDNDFHVLMNRKGEPTVLKKQSSRKEIETVHNKSKNYVIPEGTPVPYLVKLGVMSPEGKVYAKMYDKFRQINRFLEFIRDILPALPKQRTIHIIDFGCGKAYLTFAMYHYLTSICGYQVEIHGLDLKQDVVDHCHSLAKEFGYEGLSFSKGDIKGYQPSHKVDLVVTLHACDTATDAALLQAVKWDAEVILSVPCCQHELYSQVKNSELDAILRHGILKERFASLVTDAARVEMLEAVGYKTQIMEFIDMAHTPKNLLIRAVKSKPNPQALIRYNKLKAFLNIDPAIDQLFKRTSVI